MGMTDLIFVVPGKKVNGQYYRDVLLSADAASDKACEQATRLSFNRTTLHLIVQRTPLNSYSKKCRTSLVLVSGHKTAQT